MREWAKLAAPDSLMIGGVVYYKGDPLPLLKGDAQKLAKKLRREGVNVGFEYEDRAESVVSGRHDTGDQDDAHGNIGAELGAGAAGHGQGQADAEGGKRPRRGRPPRANLSLG